MSKQRLLFITTGGTIASVRTQQGLKPVLSSEELLAHLPELKELCCPETLALCSIDSTDLGQEHWLMMARAIQENYALYDGFIICHGTDTLAYSAAALSYLIQNADKPIILTGAQQPISNEITDAKKNLRDSVVCAIDPGSRGVMVVFGGHVIAGTRAKKNKTISYDAFAEFSADMLGKHVCKRIGGRLIHEFVLRHGMFCNRPVFCHCVLLLRPLVVVGVGSGL